MFEHISVPITSTIFLSLAQFLKEKGDTRSPVQAISDAVDYWMENADWKPELLRQNAGRGYQWKALFLPDATEIRMQYKGTYHYANVEGDQITFDGQSMSPATLANNIAGSSRNAWRDLWIKRPSDYEWKLADECRPEESP